MSVMVVLHQSRSPEPCTSERSPHLHDYGPGRVCGVDGCGTVLRRTHAGEVCEQCSDNGREIEEGKMTTHSKDRERVLEFLRDRAGQELPRATVAEWLGLSLRTVGQHVRYLVAAGHDIAIAYPQPGKRGEPTYTYSSSDGSPPVAPPEKPATAPVEARPPSSETDSDSPAGPVPFAGAFTLDTASVRDPEVVAIERCVRALEGIDEVARESVLIYLKFRYTDGL